jgi:hypothetical protein
VRSVSIDFRSLACALGKSQPSGLRDSGSLETSSHLVPRGYNPGLMTNLIITYKA